MINQEKHRSTTILCVRKGNEVVIASDGQVTLGHMVEKNTARKLRVFKDGKIVAGFAGSVADCMTLLDRLEKKIDQYNELLRACYELAKEWRTDKYIRNLEASIIIANSDMILTLSGDGNVLEPEKKDIASVGSGSVYALASARALFDNTDLSAEEIVRKSMEIAGDMCIYTNHNLSIEKIKINNNEGKKKKVSKSSGKVSKKSSLKRSSGEKKKQIKKQSVKNNKKSGKK